MSVLNPKMKELISLIFQIIFKCILTDLIIRKIANKYKNL